MTDIRFFLTIWFVFGTAAIIGYLVLQNICSYKKFLQQEAILIALLFTIKFLFLK